jgi:hypothetical protein
MVESAIPSRWLKATYWPAYQRTLAAETQERLTNVHLPFLPFKHMPIYLETNTFRLHYMQRLRCLALLPLLSLSLCGILDEVWEEVVGRERRRNAGAL